MFCQKIEIFDKIYEHYVKKRFGQKSYIAKFGGIRKTIINSNQIYCNQWLVQVMLVIPGLHDGWPRMYH